MFALSIASVHAPLPSVVNKNVDNVGKDLTVSVHDKGSDVLDKSAVVRITKCWRVPPSYLALRMRGISVGSKTTLRFFKLT